MSPRALEAYLKGVHELDANTDTTYERAISYFEEACRIQPDFALAQAQLREYADEPVRLGLQDTR